MDTTTQNSSGGGQPFILQLIESVTALSLPVGGGLAAWAKWRKAAERDRRAREEAARIASEKAASEARKQEQQMRDRLLLEKDVRIKEQADRLTALEDENERLQAFVQTLLSGHRGE